MKRQPPVSLPQIFLQLLQLMFYKSCISFCPSPSLQDENLSQEYGDSLRRYLASKEHLSRNIVSAQFVHETSRSLRNSFVHTVAVVLEVKTERLWESAASYIRKHLGATNEWSRGNGTVIKLSRIH